MTHSVIAAIAIGLLAPANAAIVWDTTYGKSPARRLALGLVNSHNNTDDAACIVGGYDPDHPTRIYVGGPCSLITDGQPQTGFRYVVMETVDAALEGTDGREVDMEAYLGSGSTFQYSADNADYAEAGAGMKVHFSDAAFEHASLFLSTTSYLSKANFEFRKNSFILGIDENNASKKTMVQDVCVTPCTFGVDQDSYPIPCLHCSSFEPISVTKGMYKYSVLAAAWNYPDWLSDKGWGKLVETHGTGATGSKSLSGSLNVYQAIDFTNMQAETLTVTATDDTSVTYAQMDPCNMETFKSTTDTSANCTTYSVKAVLVESDGWKGSYAFPLTFNTGRWRREDENSQFYSADLESTRTVVIKCVRPRTADLVTSGMSASSKAIYLQYKFNVSGGGDLLGFSSGSNVGQYMVYDPTVTTKSASGSSSGSDSDSDSSSGSISAGRIACEPAAAFFTTMFLVAFSGFM